jgi:hypothetical protein
MLKYGSKAAFTFLQFAFQLLLAGNIASNFRRANDLSGTIGDRRDTDGNVNSTSIPANSNRIEVLDDFAVRDFLSISGSSYSRSGGMIMSID